MNSKRRFIVNFAKCIFFKKAHMTYRVKAIQYLEHCRPDEFDVIKLRKKRRKQLSMCIIFSNHRAYTKFFVVSNKRNFYVVRNVQIHLNKIDKFFSYKTFVTVSTRNEQITVYCTPFFVFEKKLITFAEWNFLSICKYKFHLKLQ